MYPVHTPGGGSTGGAGEGGAQVLRENAPLRPWRGTSPSGGGDRRPMTGDSYPFLRSRRSTWALRALVAIIEKNAKTIPSPMKI